MNLVRNVSPQERTITVVIADKPIEVTFGRPSARVKFDALPKEKQIGAPPAPEAHDLRAVAERHGIKPDEFVKAFKADPTYQVWLADGHFAEA